MSEVERTELVTDELYSLDVQFISDDDKYFPFEVPADLRRFLGPDLCVSAAHHTVSYLPKFRDTGPFLHPHVFWVVACMLYFFCRAVVVEQRRSSVRRAHESDASARK